MYVRAISCTIVKFDSTSNYYEKLDTSAFSSMDFASIVQRLANQLTSLPSNKETGKFPVAYLSERLPSLEKQQQAQQEPNLDALVVFSQATITPGKDNYCTRKHKTGLEGFVRVYRLSKNPKLVFLHVTPTVEEGSPEIRDNNVYMKGLICSDLAQFIAEAVHDPVSHTLTTTSATPTVPSMSNNTYTGVWQHPNNNWMAMLQHAPGSFQIPATTNLNTTIGPTYSKGRPTMRARSSSPFMSTTTMAPTTSAIPQRSTYGTGFPASSSSLPIVALPHADHFLGTAVPILRGLVSQTPIVSLEEAVRPLGELGFGITGVELMDIATQYKEDAKRLIQGAFTGMPIDSVGCIRMYSDAALLFETGGTQYDFHTMLTRQMASPSRTVDTLQPWKSMIKLLLESLSQLPSSCRVFGTVYMAVHAPAQVDLLAGTHITWHSFASMTSDADVVRKQLEGQQHGLLFCVEDAKGWDISWLSHSPQRKEVLLAPPVRLGIVSSGLEPGVNGHHVVVKARAVRSLYKLSKKGGK
eukprot:TRINITY_DN52069_c0_g1_i1.p1 TRINITY_DN52069_c0_g1~~TRINITY_DN52069_c0_g1_i1.p1  ORF type:complete len:608 (+),score=52.78 TRINITY_DN52069_c0_g1_i1:252-1826(+)